MNAIVEAHLQESAPGETNALALVARPGQYLTFMLAGDEFAIGILRIKEIIEHHSITPVPMMPTCMRGVINLRGAAVPVIDLLVRFGKAPSELGKRSCIVIVEREVGGQTQVMGVVVDAVNEVLDICPSEIEPAPAFGKNVRTDFIQGMGKVQGKFVILLNVDHVLSMDELDALSLASEVPTERTQLAIAS
jgi:purine-binding chemotaxis protein CheW